MSTNANFAATPKVGTGIIAGANTARDGTGANVVTVFTAGANGSIVDKVTAKAQAVTAAGMIRWFLHDGTNYRLAYEMTVDAITPSATVAGWSETAPVVDVGGANDVFPMLLPNGYSLRATSHNGEQVSLIAQGGDF